MALAHQHYQVLKVHEREVMNYAQVDSSCAILFEAKLLHDGHAEHVVAKVVLVDHE